MITVLHDLEAVVTMSPMANDPIGAVGFRSGQTAYVLFAEGVITDVGVGPAPIISGAEYVSLPSLIAVPGGIYGHNHSFQHGLLHQMWGLPIDQWLLQMARTAFEFTPEIYYAQAYASYAQALLGGVTHVVDFPYFGGIENAHAHIRAALDVGIRLTLVWGAIDDRKSTDYPPYPREAYQEIDEYLSTVDALIKLYRSQSTVRFSLGPCTPFNATRNLFLSCAEYVRSLPADCDVTLHTHWAETQWEVSRIKDRYGLSMSGFLENIGWCKGLPVTLGHAIEIDETDVQFLSAHSIGVVRCPRTDNRAKPRVAPMGKLFEHGVAVGIGADGDPVLPAFHLATEARWLKTTNPPPRELRWDSAWRMLTSEGARAIHWSKGGLLVPDKVADIAVYGLSELPLRGGVNPFSAFVFEKAPNPHQVWCNGKLAVKEGRLLRGSKSYREINQQCVELVLPILKEVYRE